MYCMNCFFVDNVVRAAFLCEHVRLSRFFTINLLTFLRTCYVMNVSVCLSIRLHANISPELHMSDIHHFYA